MATRGIVIYCVNVDCRKPILRDAYLRIGTRFSVRCFSCGQATGIESAPSGIVRTLIKIDIPLTKEPERDKVDEQDNDAFCFVVDS